MSEEETKDVEMDEDEDSEEEDSDEGESDEGSGDSDKELQIAFEKGETMISSGMALCRCGNKSSVPE